MFDSFSIPHIPLRIRFQWNEISFEYFLTSVFYKHAHCLAATVLDTADTVGNNKTWSCPRESSSVSGEDKKQISTATNNMRVTYREDMRAYNRVFGWIRKVKRGL